MYSRRSDIAGLMLVLSVGNADASTFSKPVPIVRQEVFSRNEEFVLDVNPQANVNTIYSAADRGTPLWSFPGQLDSDVRSIYLADSGSTVAILMEEASPSSSARGVGVQFYFRDRAMISYQVSEFMTPRETISFGCGLPRVHWVEVAVDQGDQLVITTTEGRDFVLDYESPQLRRQKLPTRAIVVGLVVTIGVIAVAQWIRRSSRTAPEVSPA